MNIKRTNNHLKSFISLLFFFSAIAIPHIIQAQNNLARTATATASSHEVGFGPENAIDGKASSWRSMDADSFPWIMVKLPGATEIFNITLKSENDQAPISNFKIQTMLNGTWRDVKQISENNQNTVDLVLDKPILTDRIRFMTESSEAGLSELEIYGQQYVDSSAMDVKDILVNQSGYNLHKPKRFTAPNMTEKVPFDIVRQSDQETVFSGYINRGVGDFTEFNPHSDEEYTIVADGSTSFPFRIGPNWLERVTYRNLVDFMIGARHYVGTTDKIRSLSWEWRDGDFFNWGLQSLVALYLSNPVAYKRMEQTIHYVPNSSFPANYKRLWGELEPYKSDTPDLIQLIHWDADIKISQQLDHEMQKAELAHFLYAWPYLKKWLPQQNFDKVYEYITGKWEKPTVEAHSTTQYDLSPDHNLLSLKTQLGTTKGELPPGHSVIPNLMMYEVALRMEEKDAKKYFDAAFRQMKWMIENLDWEDPMTTKGQRMSEHITMRSFAYFYHQYPEKAPSGLKQKVEDWAEVALSRSNNFWDFRKYSDDEWTPPSWNETGNILGFPAAALSAMSVLEDPQTIKELEILVWSHFDNAFGRNPVGRHYSYKGPEEIEGVDLGWYNRHQGGIGLLDDVRFVFDGSPKSFHYPNHPEVGNLGWTEGWVQFNTAFNTSMAYLANYYTHIQLEKSGENQVVIHLEAPLNFYQQKEEGITVQLSNGSRQTIPVRLKEESPFSSVLIGKVNYHKNRLEFQGNSLSIHAGDYIEVKYGHGYFEKSAKLLLE